MTVGEVAYCIGFAVLLAAGQILFKSAALALPNIRNFSDLTSVIQVPALWIAIVLYGGATVLWVYLLQTVPLSRAYPFAALGFVLVPAAGVMLFHERVSGAYLGGTVLVITGISLISLS